jgi:hypothetical protein
MACKESGLRKITKCLVNPKILLSQGVDLQE